MYSPQVVETHISLLFCVGDRVYKLRKPVQFGFLDFRDPEARRLDCEREIALNRRLAPDVYLGVADIEMNGETVDHMVVMRRMPETAKLAALARTGSDLDSSLRQVAEVLVSFHAKAARSPEISTAATATALRAGWEENFAETDSFVGTVLDDSIETEIRSLARGWTDGHASLLNERIAAGRVCDGHGDLQAEDIFILDDGVRILDCIEFSDRLRYCDVASDVAFLAMDLERLGRPDAAERFLLQYREISGDTVPESLTHYYCASRAYVRAKVCCLRWAQGADDEHAAVRLLHTLALEHLRKARAPLVLVGGLPGSGKSTLAAGLGTDRNWAVFRSDEIRRETGRLGEVGPSGYRVGRYSAEATDAVYRELLRRAERLLECGEPVVLDASWVSAFWRDQVRTIADRTASDLVELCCVAAPEEADRRLLRRLSHHGDVSEATPEVRAAMSRSMDPWASAVPIDTSASSPKAALDLAKEAIRRRGGVDR
jgi:hypothetical protein